MKIKSLSLVVFILISLFVVSYRITHVGEKEISWDVLGYYLYLPSTFIHHDPLLTDIEWLKKLNQEKDLAGTLYMVSTNDNGEPMYFFLMGMSLFYMPFFILASVYSYLFNYPVDGFSMPYQYFLVIGGIIYTIIGLIFLRKILLRFFSDRLTAFIMIIITFGTNYIHHLTLDNLGTVNVLFMLLLIVAYYTILWYETFKNKYFYIISAGIALITLVKPSEIFVFLIPLLWNINSLKDLPQRILFFIKRYQLLLKGFVIFLLIVLPQLIYWKIKTGHFIYDSYKNPGIGLDIFSPHILEVLFSYRKGWILYTPVMIFSLIGFFVLYKNYRNIFYAIFIYFLISFWVISSWTEWWYGAGFSIRPLITSYPILAISMGSYLNEIKKYKWVNIFSILMIILLILFNQFQWWQLRNYILDPYRTTEKYYWAIFLKTSIPENAEDIKSIYRDFYGKFEFKDVEKYQKPLIYTENFDDTLSNKSKSKVLGHYQMSEGQEFLPLFEEEYCDLTSRDHFWIIAHIDVKFDSLYNDIAPCLVMTMERKEGAYGYRTIDLIPDSARGKWYRFNMIYLTPEIRSKNDRFKCYIWNRSKKSFEVDNFEMKIYKPKK